jgi:hypothetical protein
VEKVMTKISDGLIKNEDYRFKNKEKLKSKIKELGFEIEEALPDIVNIDKKEVYYTFNEYKVADTEKYLKVLDELKMGDVINQEINNKLFDITSLSFLSSIYSIISYDKKSVTFYLYKKGLNDEQLNKLKSMTNTDDLVLSESILDKAYLIGLDYNLETKKIEDNLRLYFTVNRVKYEDVSEPLTDEDLKEFETILDEKINDIKTSFEIEKELEALAVVIENGALKHYNYYF